MEITRRSMLAGGLAAAGAALVCAPLARAARPPVTVYRSPT
jgi:hypothetical protein